MRRRKTYQNRGGKRHIKMSKSTGRLRKGLSYRGSDKYVRHVGRDVKHAWRKGVHLGGQKAAYKRKRYYKRNLNYSQ